MIDLRKRRAKLSAQDKELAEEYNNLEQALMNFLDETKQDGARAGAYTASIIEEEYPQVVDWEPLTRYILRHKALYLLPRRVLSAAYREVKKSRRGNKDLPGMTTFTKRSLSLKKTR